MTESSSTEAVEAGVGPEPAAEASDVTGEQAKPDDDGTTKAPQTHDTEPSLEEDVSVEAPYTNGHGQPRPDER